MSLSSLNTWYKKLTQFTLWILLPFSPDWRRMLNTTTSPWYPSATLFRQDAQAGWDEVLQRVADALAQQSFADSAQ